MSFSEFKQIRNFDRGNNGNSTKAFRLKLLCLLSSLFAANILSLSEIKTTLTRNTLEFQKRQWYVLLVKMGRVRDLSQSFGQQRS